LDGAFVVLHCAHAAPSCVQWVTPWAPAAQNQGVTSYGGAAQACRRGCPLLLLLLCMRLGGA